MLKKEMKPINGDPLTFENDSYRVKIEWYDRVFGTYLEPYKDWGEENEHANEARGWTELWETVPDPDEDITVRWWEYKGKSVKDDEKAPLVVCFDEYYNQTWNEVADANGLIVMAFEYHRNFQLPEAGMGALGFGPRPREIRGYKHCIDEAIEKYNIDTDRIYLNGLSYGDMSALNIAHEYPDLFAAIVLMNGPTSTFNCNNYGFPGNMPAIPSMQLRGDNDRSSDGFPDGLSWDAQGNEEWQRHTRSMQTLFNRDLWMKQDGCEGKLPLISSKGKRVFIKYVGDVADVIYNEMNNRNHIAAVDYAQVMWDNLYSVWKRGANGPEKIGEDALTPDKGAIGLVAGTNKAYIDHKIVELDAPCLIVAPYLPISEDAFFYGEKEGSYESFYASADLIKKGFGIDYELIDLDNLSKWAVGADKDNSRFDLDDKIIKFEACGKTFELYANTAVVIVDGHVEEIERPALTIDGNLMIPVKEFAALLGLYSSERNDAIYVCDHYMELGHTFSRILREEILCPELKETEFSIETGEGVNGKFTIDKTTVELGGSVTIDVTPDEGYVVDEVIGYMRGLSAPMNQLEENKYILINILGDCVIDVTFKKA